MRLPTVLSVLPLIFTACATGPSYSSLDPAVDAPTFTATMPAINGSETSLRQEPAEEFEKTLPLGAGFTASPKALLFAVAFDVPVDQNLTVGPAAHLGFGDNRELYTLYLKGKYWLPGAMEGDDGRPKLKPYVTAGAGGVYYDEDGRKSDTAVFFNGGAGLRFLTGDKHRIGSEVLLNWAPNKVGDERTWFSWEVIQLVLDF